MRRLFAHRARIVAAALLTAGAAHGQSRTGFAIDRFEPAERGSGWFVVDGLDLRGRARPALGVTFDYAYKPLVVYDAAHEERLAIVRHQTFVHAGGSLVLRDRVRLGIDVPLALYQDGDAAFVSGEALAPANRAALGDLRVAADLRLAGEHGEPFTAAIGLRGWLPTGVRSQFTSDGSARLAPQLLAAGRIGVLTWAARAAIVFRSRGDAYAGTPLGTGVDTAAGLGLQLGRLFFGPEVFASTGLDADAFLSAHGTPVDAVLGAHSELPLGLRLGLGAGGGLTRGYGSPAFRGLVALEWSVPIPAPSPDRDRDRVPDANDACPDVPGMPSGDPELDGCLPPERVPDEDTDGDGIRDSDDACPGIRGVWTDDRMTNGCPTGTPHQLAVVTATEIRVGERIQFATGSADLLGDSEAVLGAVSRLLDEHPEIRRLRVEGHTDDTGDASFNFDLSQRRATAVLQWLVQHGVDEGRLVREGFGSTRPLATNLTEQGRLENRRVAFTILERAPRR